MTLLKRTVAVSASVMLLASMSLAQPPGGPGGRGGPGRSEGGPGRGGSASNGMVTQLMSYDKNKDGKLAKDELTDTRLQRIFERADADKDGFVTKDELTTMFTKSMAESGTQRGGPGGPGGGRGGRFGPPQPGQILPDFMQDELKLTDAQKKQLATLQKEITAKLNKILTDEQQKQLKEMGERSPGGPGGGPGGPGGERSGRPDRPDR